jgi:DNA replication licensing factor MCM3
MNNDRFAEVEVKIAEFLQQSDIKDNIQRAHAEKTRCNINLDNLRKYDKVLAEAVLKHPERCIIILEKKLNEMMKDFNDDVTHQKLRAQSHTDNFPTKTESSHVNFTGNFGRHYITPRGLKAHMLNKLVRVQGIVTRMSNVSPKLEKSYHYVDATKSGHVKSYSDNFSITEDGTIDKSTSFPTTDPAGNRMTADFGYCKYTKLQKLVVQELPERAPPGQLPRSITIILEDDLVDKVKPGDRIEVTGVYKTIPNERSSTSGVFQTIIYGTGIESLADQKKDSKIDAQDIANIKRIAKRKDIFDLLANSVAPSIYGHHSVKKGLLLQLLGGVEKTVQGTGTHLRGDINMLLVGDPSTAKSQLLRQMMEISPLAINTTGRGSSGVGLTAAVIIDKDTGERHLEAGAMVLADRGIVCIDEFDKMSDADRVAIHEVMEQQTVTISKAGIHASLNARCSVVAAANPIYGDYDITMSAAKNIGLPDSLLSRFDLLFVILDDKDPNVNGKIAERVILNHRFKKPGERNVALIGHDDVLVEPDLEIDEDEKKKVFESDFSSILQGTSNEETPDHDVLNRNFFKKYLSYAKSSYTPVLNEEAVEFLSSSYSLLRLKGEEPDQMKEKKLPITARTLETLIRLATAHAKLRLSQEVDVGDMQTALKLLNFSIFTHDENDVKESSPKEEIKEEEENTEQRTSKRSKNKDGNGYLKVNMAAARKLRSENKENVNHHNTRPITRGHLSSKEQVDIVLNESINASESQKLDARKKQIYKVLTTLQRKHIKADSFTIDQINDELYTVRNSSRVAGTIQKEEIQEIISSLEKEQKVMIIEGGCILI